MKKKEKTEWHKTGFEREIKYIYEFEIQNGISCIHRNKVNKIYEWNLLHDIINPTKHTKN